MNILSIFQHIFQFLKINAVNFSILYAPNVHTHADAHANTLRFHIMATISAITEKQYTQNAETLNENAFQGST